MNLNAYITGVINLTKLKESQLLENKEISLIAF